MTIEVETLADSVTTIYTLLLPTVALHPSSQKIKVYPNVGSSNLIEFNFLNIIN